MDLPVGSSYEEICEKFSWVIPEYFNIADAIFTLEALFGSTTTPWPLISDCVLDNTEGPLECNSFLACPEND